MYKKSSSVTNNNTCQIYSNSKIVSCDNGKRVVVTQIVEKKTKNLFAFRPMFDARWNSIVLAVRHGLPSVEGLIPE